MSQTKVQLVSNIVGNVSGGASFTGIVTATSFYGESATINGNVSIAGTLTYEDVTNVDSIGLVTARSGIVLGPTANIIRLGTGTTISSPASDTFTILTGGSERVRVNSSGQFGLGTNSPGAVLHSYAAVSGGNPSTSGTTDANVAARFQASSVNFDVGVQAAGHIWLQPRLVSNFSSNFNLLLCPNGGSIGVGTVSASANLHVNASNGTILLTGVTNTSGIELGVREDGQDVQIISKGSGGSLRFYTNPTGGVTERARISSTGGFSVGTTANPGTGAIYATGDITAFYSSDIRLKKDIEPISEPIKKLMEISGVTYKWNEEYLKDKEVDGYFVRETEVGVIAQEVEKVLPEVVATRENGYKAVRYEKLVALLIEAVKDQQHQIDELKARLEEK